MFLNHTAHLKQSHAQTGEARMWVGSPHSNYWKLYDLWWTVWRVHKQHSIRSTL